MPGGCRRRLCRKDQPESTEQRTMEAVTMSTKTDPRIVREIAEAALRRRGGGSRVDRVEAALIAAGVAGPILGEKFDAYSKAVGAEYDRLEAAAGIKTVTCPPRATPSPASTASEADMCGVHGCTCGNFPESCDLDTDLPENAPVVGCQQWQSRNLEN